MTNLEEELSNELAQADWEMEQLRARIKELESEVESWKGKYLAL